MLSGLAKALGFTEKLLKSYIFGDVFRATTLIEPYQQSIPIFRAVNMISSDLSKLPIKFYTGNRMRPNEEKLIDKPNQTCVDIEKLFYNPNPENKGDFIKTLSLYLELYGEAPLYIPNFKPGKIPTFAQPLFPKDLVEITNGTDILKWSYSTREFLNIAEIKIPKYINPRNKFRGISPCSVGDPAISKEFYADQYVSAYFKNGCQLGTTLVLKDGQPEDAAKMRDILKDEHRGAADSWKPRILTGDVTSINMSSVLKDLDVSAISQLSINHISMLYGIPPTMLGQQQDVKSMGGNDTDTRKYWENCIIPRATFWEDWFYWNIFYYLPDQVWFKFDFSGISALKDDQKIQAETLKVYISCGIPLNDAVKKLNLGFPDYEWGNEPYNPNQMTIPAELLPTPEEKPKQIERKEVLLDTKKLAIRKKAWNNYLKIHSPIESACKKKISKWVYGLRKETLKNLESYLSSVGYTPGSTKSKLIKDSAILDYEKSLKQLQTMMKPIYQISLKAGAKSAAELIGSSSFSFAPLDARFSQIIESRLNDPKIMNIPQNIKDKIMNSVSEGISKAKTVTEISQRIKDDYNEISNSITIARTETGTMINTGRQECMLSEGVEYHSWLSAQDDNVREEHQIDGETVKLGDAFSNGLIYPNDPSGDAGNVCNCRCTTIPESKEGSDNG